MFSFRKQPHNKILSGHGRGGGGGGGGGDQKVSTLKSKIIPVLLFGLIKKW